MALHYNLSKVYQLSDNDSEFVNQILVLFVNEIPKDLLEIKTGIYSELHKKSSLILIKSSKKTRSETFFIGKSASIIRY